MLTFYILVAVMIILALFPVIRVLLGKSTIHEAVESEQVPMAIYKQRLAELEKEKKQGLIDEDQEKAAKAELDRSLLDEMGKLQSSQETRPIEAKKHGSRMSMGAITLFLPIVAIALYHNLGAPTLIPILQQETPQQVAEQGHGSTVPSVEDMVASLATRLEQNPDDVEGLFLLARSYASMRRYQEAADIYARLYSLTGDRVEVLLPYADTLAMASDGRIAGLPEQLVHKALVMDPMNITGLWLAGLASFEHKEFRDALGYWQKLLPQFQPGSEQAGEVQTLIDRARAELGETVSEPVAVASVPALAPAGDAVAQTVKTLGVKVTLAAEFVNQATPEQIVFIYAQPVDGSPMPVAVVRKQVKDLPLEVVLDDSMAMMPTQKLSNFEQVTISARISKSGIATPQSGDLIAQAIQVEVDRTEAVSLQINQLVP